VSSAANRLVADVAKTGASKRVVVGLGGLVAVLAPGLAALALIAAARATMAVRGFIALGVTLLGVASYFYHPGGQATGVLVLALVIAGLVLVVSGPLVVAPLALGAGLIGAEFLPTVISGHVAATSVAVNDLHQAIFATPGTPLALEVGVLVVAILPFAVAVRLMAR